MLRKMNKMNKSDKELFYTDFDGVFNIYIFKKKYLLATFDLLNDDIQISYCIPRYYKLKKIRKESNIVNFCLEAKQLILKELAKLYGKKIT